MERECVDFEAEVLEQRQKLKLKLEAKQEKIRAAESKIAEWNKLLVDDDKEREEERYHIGDVEELSATMEEVASDIAAVLEMAGFDETARQQLNLVLSKISAAVDPVAPREEEEDCSARDAGSEGTDHISVDTPRKKDGGGDGPREEGLVKTRRTDAGRVVSEGPHILAITNGD